MMKTTIPTQLDLFAGISSKEEIKERLATLFVRTLRDLRFLKVNTLLCEELEDKDTVVSVIDDLIEVACRIHVILTDSDRDIGKYVKDCQDVMVYAYIPVSLEQLYDIMSQIKHPRSKLYDFGTGLLATKFEDLRIELKELRDDLQSRVGQDSI